MIIWWAVCVTITYFHHHHWPSYIYIFLVVLCSLQIILPSAILDNNSKLVLKCNITFIFLYHKEINIELILVTWALKFGRATYSKMAEELNSLLVSTPAENSTPDVQMSCFDTMLGAPLPEDQRSAHLQEAISVFTYLLSDDSGP